MSATNYGNADVVTLVVTMPIRPEAEQEFVDFATSFIPKIQDNEPGTVLYSLHEHPTEASTYVWVERYQDQAALDSHEGSELMASAQSKLPGWLGGQPEMLKLRQVAPA